MRYEGTGGAHILIIVGLLSNKWVLYGLIFNQQERILIDKEYKKIGKSL